MMPQNRISYFFCEGFLSLLFFDANEDDDDDCCCRCVMKQTLWIVCWSVSLCTNKSTFCFVLFCLGHFFQLGIFLLQNRRWRRQQQILIFNLQWASAEKSNDDDDGGTRQNLHILLICIIFISEGNFLLRMNISKAFLLA